MADYPTYHPLTFDSTIVLILIVVMAVATFLIMWNDFRLYREEHHKRTEHLKEFIKEEMQYLLVFIMFVALIIVEFTMHVVM